MLFVIEIREVSGFVPRFFPHDYIIAEKEKLRHSFGLHLSYKFVIFDFQVLPKRVSK